MNKAMDKLIAAQIERKNNMTLAHNAKARGEIKAMVAWVRAARRYHAKARMLAKKVDPATANQIMGWRLAA
jgi:hypothetical protein